MEAKLSGYSLNDALMVMRKVISGRISLPKLALIKVSCFIGYTQLQATNLETYLTIQVPAETLEVGEVCVYGEDFFRCAMRESKVLRLFTKDGHLVVQSDEVESGISLMPVEGWPSFPVPTYQSTLPTKLLLSAIERVEFVVAKHKNAMGYAYLLVDGEGGSVNFVGSDAYRFAVFRAEVPFDDRIKLPYSSLEALKELLEKEEKEVVKVGKAKNFVFLGSTHWEMALRVKFWGYPDYKAIIPKEFKTRAVLDIKELNRALGKFSSEEEVVFQIDKGLKLIAKQSKDRTVKTIEAEINAEVEGEAITVAFNPKFVKEFTKTNKGTVEILLVDNSRPAVFKLGEDFLYLLMPKKT
jgi:DNA polymerase-3 subunit beta